MLPDRVSNPGPLTYESGALPIALRGLARAIEVRLYIIHDTLKISTCITNSNISDLHVHSYGLNNENFC